MATIELERQVHLARRPSLPALPRAAEDLQFWRKKARNRRLVFFSSFVFASLWLLFSIWVSLPWLADLGALIYPIAALLILTFMAYIPGFMNAFLLSSLVFRPKPMTRKPDQWPGVSILIAAYQEEAFLERTLVSLGNLAYPGPLEIIVIDDGSTDNTYQIAAQFQMPGAEGLKRTLRAERMPKNGGKSRALNHGLGIAAHDLIVTIDADTLLQPNSIDVIVSHLYGAPPNTAAVAGTVLVANPADSMAAAAQQWDYFHGISAVKRMQGMFNNVLVAQGAFSLYRKDALLSIGGWSTETVGEDIVATWAMIEKGYLIRHAEDAVSWTYVPTKFSELVKQRKRWARGMIEALHLHKGLLVRPRLTTMFFYWNLLFVSVDLAFTFTFIPGLVLAAFGYYWLAGIITLLLLPLAALWNIILYRIQNRMLKDQGIQMKKSLKGFVFFAVIYPFIMQPASVLGYAAELFGRKKQWG